MVLGRLLGLSASRFIFSKADIKNLPMAVAFAGLQGALVMSSDPFPSFLSKFALDFLKDGTSHKWGYLRQDFSEKVHMVEGMWSYQRT